MITFPYVEFLGLAEDRVFRPMIPVTFKANGEELKSYALVDSGADYTILPIEIVGKFKLGLGAEPNYTVQGAGGNSFTIYKSPIELEIIIKKEDLERSNANQQYFLQSQEPLSFLGKADF